MQHAADHRQRAKDIGQRATDNVHQSADDMQEDASTCEMQQGNTRHRRIPCAASSGQRTSSSMREALFSTTSAQHGTDATHKLQRTTGAAACSKHTRNRHHAAGIETNGMRDETKGSRTLAHLEAARALESRPRGLLQVLTGVWLLCFQESFSGP